MLSDGYDGQRSERTRHPGVSDPPVWITTDSNRRPRSIKILLIGTHAKAAYPCSWHSRLRRIFRRCQWIAVWSAYAQFTLPTAHTKPRDTSRSGRHRMIWSWLRRFSTSRDSDEQARAATQEDWFPVKRSDWLTLRNSIDSIKEPPSYTTNATWAALGIATSAILALALWLSIHSALPVKAQVHYSYVTPLLIITAIASVVLAVFAAFVGHQVRRLHTTSIKQVVDSMDAIYGPHSHTDSDSTHRQQE